ncbi:MAG: hypothetical protein WCO00_12270 [Rhodospirillaceae bacterium]
MTETTYICEACDGTGKGRVVADRDLGKPCQACGGRGYLTEAEMERTMTVASRPNLFDWRLFARQRRR